MYMYLLTILLYNNQERVKKFRKNKVILAKKYYCRFDISRSKIEKSESCFINEKLELKLGFLIFLPPENPRSIQVAQNVVSKFNSFSAT